VKAVEGCAPMGNTRELHAHGMRETGSLMHPQVTPIEPWGLELVRLRRTNSKPHHLIDKEAERIRQMTYAQLRHLTYGQLSSGMVISLTETCESWDFHRLDSMNNTPEAHFGIPAWRETENLRFALPPARQETQKSNSYMFATSPTPIPGTIP
jgi:hypothetical protein